MLRYLEDKPAVNALFGSVVAARIHGEMLARLVDGRPTTEFANIADRGYF